MGADYVQYMVADAASAPLSYVDHFTEKLVLMPHQLLPANHRHLHGTMSPLHRPLPPRSKYKLPADGFVFCSFNTPYKLDPVIFGTWLAILRRVPGSVLWVQASGEVRPLLLAQAAAAGVQTSRVMFLPWLEDDEHLLAKGLCQLFLDTPNYNAHVTGNDVLWAGVPLLTVPAEKMGGRIASSLVATLSQSLADELVVRSYREYEDRAVALARNQTRWGVLRKGLLESVQTSPLFDMQLYVRELERAWYAIWELHAAGAPPQHIHLVPSNA
uniref:O-GlcNAc transferase C-terminal domain-containing protein n=2 Tax=Pyramimonas obovata TaxID=1411642 RepID=A0A7S0QM75_9CHLO